jgi:hypothetical protein
MTQTSMLFATPRFRHAFRVALATIIAYWLALSFDWPNPKWAALAVAVVSLPSTAESLKKGWQRLMGTLVGAVVTLVIVSLFPQDRWTFLFCVSAWLSFCTYKMGDPRESYFWYVSGFVVAIVATNVGSDLRDAFEIAVIRSLETGLGVAVYSVVALLLWPDKEAKGNQPDSTIEATTGTTVDLDRLAAMVRFFITFWLSVIFVLYIPGFPGGMKYLGLLASFSMQLCNMPQYPVSLLYRPLVVSLMFASLFYMLLMPRLEGFPPLAVAVFAVTFYIVYRYYEPQKVIARSIGLALFVSVIAVSNEQQYSFLSAANVALMIFLLCALSLITTDVPVSTLPEKRLLWQLRRFQRSARILSDFQDVSPGLLGRLLRAYHLYEITTLPGKLAAWRGFIPGPLETTVAGELDSVMENVQRMSQALQKGHRPEEGLLARMADSYGIIGDSPLSQPRYRT